MGWSRQRRWTDDQLRGAVAAARSFSEAALRLGVRGARKGLAERARALGLDTSHFRQHRSRPNLWRWTDDDLRTAVAGARSIADVLRDLGLVAAGGNYEHVRRRIAELGLDTSHLLGRAWNKGLVHDPRPIVPLEQVLVAGRWTTTHSLKLRLFRAGVKEPRCELCGWAQRAPDGRIPVELDHINGDRNDNRLENLRILCPSCHALQPTHRGLNRRSRRAR